MTTETKVRRAAPSSASDKASAKAAINSAASGAHVGDLVWTELRGVRDAAVPRNTMRALLLTDGFDADSVMPPNVSGQAAMGRARRAAKVADGYFFDAPEKGSRDVVLMRREGVGVDMRDIVCAYITLGANDTLVVDRNDATATRESDSAIREMEKQFVWFQDFLSPTELIRLTVDLIVGQMNGVRLKKSGGLYWVPTNYSERLLAFQGIFESVRGSELSIAPITMGNHSSVGRGVAHSLADEIEAVVTRANTFRARGLSGIKVQERSLTERLNEVERIRHRASVVSEILGQQREIIEASVKAAEASVRALLAERPSWAVTDKG